MTQEAPKVTTDREEARQWQLKATAPTTADYQIKGLATFTGREGMGGYNVTLYRGKTKVAHILNEDSGGEFMWDFFGEKGTRHAEEAMIDALVKELPPIVSTIDNFTFQPDRDCWLGEMVGKHEENKFWQRKCRTAICFTLKEHKEGEYLQIKRPYHPDVKALLQKKYGSNLAEIINERYL